MKVELGLSIRQFQLRLILKNLSTLEHAKRGKKLTVQKSQTRNKNLIVHLKKLTIQIWQTKQQKRKLRESNVRPM